MNDLLYPTIRKIRYKTTIYYRSNTYLKFLTKNTMIGQKPSKAWQIIRNLLCKI